MDQVEAALNANKLWWDERAVLHCKNELKKIAKPDYKAPDIVPWTIEEVGEVKDKTLLYLQCHYGLRALAWARRGAIVVGTDFSPKSVEAAKKLASACKLDAKFIESDFANLSEKLNETFDIVYSGFSSLLWLPDLSLWAKAAAARVKSGGFLYVADFHPFPLTLDIETTNPRIAYSYFKDQPKELEQSGSYALPDAKTVNNKYFEWGYSLGEVVSAVIEAGLTIEWLKERPGAAAEATKTDF